MAIDFNTAILDLNGQELIAGEAGTIKAVCLQGLIATFPDEQDLPVGEKVKRFCLATKIAPGGSIDLTCDEVGLLKMVVGKGFGPLVVGRVWAAIDPASIQ